MESYRDVVSKIVMDIRRGNVQVERATSDICRIIEHEVGHALYTAPKCTSVVITNTNGSGSTLIKDVPADTIDEAMKLVASRCGLVHVCDNLYFDEELYKQQCSTTVVDGKTIALTDEQIEHAAHKIKLLAKQGKRTAANGLVRMYQDDREVIRWH